MGDRRQSVSACVITYNRSAIVGTCLRGVAFADEVILVDKTSTDDTRAVAARFERQRDRWVCAALEFA